MAKSADRDRTPESHLPLTAATFQILMAMVGGERHGYAIMKEVEESTAGEVRLGPGTLYGSLKRLLEEGLVEESGERADPEMGDERRRYYRLTRFGLSVARAEAKRMESVIHAARKKNLLGRRPA
jgi:DNA-binding PadR family transcriptional regulator